MSGSDGPPRVVLLAALVLGIGAIVAIVVIAAQRERAPVAIAAVPAPQAADPACAQLMAALPQRLGDFRRARAAEPVPPSTAAWQPESGADPVILRCGLERPADFVTGTPLQMVDDVSWFRVGDADRTTWFAVDRKVYVALTLPHNSGPTAIQEISRVISTTLPAQRIDPAPPR